MIIDMHLFDCEVYYGCPQVFYTLDQEAYKGEIQCPLLPNQICFSTNHNKFHADDIKLLLLSSNQNTVVHRK